MQARDLELWIRGEFNALAEQERQILSGQELKKIRSDLIKISSYASFTSRNLLHLSASNANIRLALEKASAETGHTPADIINYARCLSNVLSLMADGAFGDIVSGRSKLYISSSDFVTGSIWPIIFTHYEKYNSKLPVSRTGPLYNLLCTLHHYAYLPVPSPENVVNHVKRFLTSGDSRRSELTGGPVSNPNEFLDQVDTYWAT